VLTDEQIDELDRDPDDPAVILDAEELHRLCAQAKEANRLRESRTAVIEECVQLALKLRDEADSGKWTDVSGEGWTMGFGFAANMIGKKLRALYKQSEGT